MTPSETRKSRLSNALNRAVQVGFISEAQRTIFYAEVCRLLDREDHGEKISASDLAGVVKLWTGMGGASSFNEPSPFKAPSGAETNVYGEILDDRVEKDYSASVSRSDGVGTPLYDPVAAERRINDPAIRDKWWPDKTSQPPASSSRHPLVAWLSSWLSG